MKSVLLLCLTQFRACSLLQLPSYFFFFLFLKPRSSEAPDCQLLAFLVFIRSSTDILTTPPSSLMTASDGPNIFFSSAAPSRFLSSFSIHVAISKALASQVLDLLHANPLQPLRTWPYAVLYDQLLHHLQNTQRRPLTHPLFHSPSPPSCL